MDNAKKIRTLRNGNWYWINKTILYQYGKLLNPSGIAVYNVLASFVNSKTQACFPSQVTIAKILGMSRKSVSKKIIKLEELKLITVKRKKRNSFYKLLKPPFRRNKENMLCKKNAAIQATLGLNNNKYINNINNNIDSGNFSLPNKSEGFIPKSREELLAWDLCVSLKDTENYYLYHSYATKYSESILRKIVKEIQEIPRDKIKKSPSALFIHLIQKYDKETS